MFEKLENKNSAIQKRFVPQAENVEFIEKGDKIIRIMDKHNFYEAEHMTDDYLLNANVGLLTKLWIYISRATKEEE